MARIRALLLNKKLKVDINTSEAAALKEACRFSQIEVVKYLLFSPEIKRHANILSHGGIVGMKWACKNGDIALAEFLLSIPSLREYIKNESGGKSFSGIAILCERTELLRFIINSSELREVFVFTKPLLEELSEKVSKRNPSLLFLQSWLESEHEQLLTLKVTTDAPFVEKKVRI